MAPRKELQRYFGTDGVRGVANGFITPELALKVAQAAGLKFLENNGTHRHQVIIGKDTRLSCYMIESAMQAGFTSVGMDVLLTGPLPTPGIAMLTRSMRCDMGVMISASHNGYEDNGIKLFGADGFKLPDEVEEAIENLIHSDLSSRRAGPKEFGRAKRIDDAQRGYIEFVKLAIPRNVNFEGLTIVLDCANGAAHSVGPQLLKELGATVIPVGVDPNGTNINEEVGSTHPRVVAAQVLLKKADVGVALDGDADRVIFIDEKGQVVDGDQILAVIATSLQEEKKLRGSVVSTVMANLGFERYCGERGIGFERTSVGDRYVIERMRELDANVGGEQSGHIICSDYATTGDGLLAALQVLAVLKKEGRPASEALQLFNPVPQVHRKFKDPQKRLLGEKKVKDVVAKAEEALGKSGLVVRYSGTEPIIRIMAQGDDRAKVEQAVDSIYAELHKAAA